MLGNVNNNDIEIRNYLEYCYKIKLIAFSNNNLFLINNIINKEPLINNIQILEKISQIFNIKDDDFNYYYKNSNSFILDENMDQSFDQDIKIGKINKYQLYLGDDN